MTTDLDIESVWDYPRPPRLEAVPERIRALVDGIVIADSTRAYRVRGPFKGEPGTIGW